MSERIRIIPRVVGYVLGGIAIYLAAQSLFNEFLIETFLIDESSTPLELVLDLFSVNLEESIPTWYATINLFIASTLLAVIAYKAYRHTRPLRHYWGGLAIIFLYLSMDEGAAIHEIAGSALSDAFSTTNFLAFGWQIAALPLLLIFGLIYLRFLFALPGNLRNLLIAAATIYIGGALVVESISANAWYNDGVTLRYLAIATVEEVCEMLGVVVLIYALLLHLRGDAITLQVDSNARAIASDPDAEPAKKMPRRSLWRSILAISVGIILCMNLAFIVLTSISIRAVEGASVASSEPTEFSLLAFFITVNDTYGDDNLTITQMSGVFGVDREQTNPVATSLARLDGEIMIVGFPSLNQSLVFMGASLPFTQNEMAELLRSHSQTEFIVLETQAVRSILGFGT